MDDIDTKCWLCGREVPPREGTRLMPYSGIPIHRECLDDGRQGFESNALVAPEDVLYFSTSLFRT